MNAQDYCVVIGGVNVDIGGKAVAPLIPKDSNPGKINVSFGGVARNVAHNMRLLGLNVKLITALGEDDYAAKVKKDCERLKIDIEGYLSCPNESTSSYMFMTDKSGDMVMAISDMDIYRHITPQYLETRMDEINKAKVVVVDTNIPTESIAYLAKRCKVPIFADPVSSTKAARLIPALSDIYGVTPNSLETRILTGVKVYNEESLEEASKKFFDTGVKYVLISLGADGVYVSNKKESVYLKTIPGKVVNTTGAGDAMMAGFIYGFLNDRPLKEMGLIGLATATFACETTNTINEEITIEKVLDRVGLL